MALLSFKKKSVSDQTYKSSAVEAFLKGYSIEVTPRSAAKIGDFREIRPKGTRAYIAHVEGTPIKDMVATAMRLANEGFPVMPHFPARLIKDRETLADWIARYQGEAGVNKALLLAGGMAKPCGDFRSSMQLLETGLFDRAGFLHLHVAAHPEGNRNIDPDGLTTNVDAALLWKQKYHEISSAKMALVMQFAFDAQLIINWADTVKAKGVSIPINIGIAGPAKLQTLIKFSIACGIGPSLRVLQKRALDLSRLLLSYGPSVVVTKLADHKAIIPDFNITKVHFFPLGGISANAQWAIQRGGSSAILANLG